MSGRNCRFLGMRSEGSLHQDNCEPFGIVSSAFLFLSPTIAENLPIQYAAALESTGRFHLVVEILRNNICECLSMSKNRNVKIVSTPGTNSQHRSFSHWSIWHVSPSHSASGLLEANSSARCSSVCFYAISGLTTARSIHRIRSIGLREVWLEDHEPG